MFVSHGLVRILSRGTALSLILHDNPRYRCREYLWDYFRGVCWPLVVAGGTRAGGEISFKFFENFCFPLSSPRRPNAGHTSCFTKPAPASYHYSFIYDFRSGTQSGFSNRLAPGGRKQSRRVLTLLFDLPTLSYQ